MARDRCTFRQGDVTKALRAARDAGLALARVEIARDGKITMVPGKPETEVTTPDTNKNEFGE